MHLTLPGPLVLIFILASPSILGQIQTTARECAACPQEITVTTSGYQPQTSTYELALRSVQAQSVICGYFQPTRGSKLEEKRNGWAYCEYDDKGKEASGNLPGSGCPISVKQFTLNCTQA
ncbi:hypothetical protein C8F01DRAFT_125047 [Mycena amicta]|nr:hypothetical protein C8F01DRAFT_125047 [Mycena amicta]